MRTFSDDLLTRWNMSILVIDEIALLRWLT